MPNTNAPEAPGWGRRRLLMILVGAAALVLALLAGLVYGVLSSLAGPPEATSQAANGPVTTRVELRAGRCRREQVAAAPMLQVGPDAARGGTPAATPGPTFQAPPATTDGPAAVPTGYPRTPAGAVGQLAAIDTTVVAGMSVEHATTVYQAWSLPGAPASQPVGDDQPTCAPSSPPAAPAADPVVTATPVAAQVKGSDGPDWVLACVLLRLDAVAASLGVGRVRALRTDAVAPRPVADRPRRPARARAVDLARHRPRPTSGVAHLGPHRRAGLTTMRTDGWDDLINPFTYLGNAAGKVAADAWTAAMLALWNGGLWLLRLVLGFIDTFLTPDLRESGPMAEVYRITFWVAATLVIALAAVQSGVAAFRRDGRALARLLVGAGQFVMVWAAWISYALLLLYACSGLTTAIMRATMGVDAWAQWQPWGTWTSRTSPTARSPPSWASWGCS